uniref:BSD domain-containing protein n=1 Tax=Glycine max TaxID=3847 RepID=C6TED3_SOYBN|nr:unknown [Glycine max]
MSWFARTIANSLRLDDDDDGVLGVTEDVVAFARSVALHPETWLDFPLPDDEDSDDFDLSDAQQEHALAVEHLAPSLAALRMELCPGYMSDGNFWKIYFVLVHPRLSKTDAAILSTPQIMEARAMLTQALDKRSKEKKESDLSAGGNIPSKEEEQHLFVPSNAQLEPVPLQTSAAEAAPSVVVSDVEMEKHVVPEIIDKSVVKEAPVISSAEQSSSGSTNRFLDETYDDDADDWLKEEDTSEMVGPSGTSVHTGNDEDVSFSDLEEDDGDVHESYKKTRSGSDSSTKDSRDWVQLGRSSPNSDKDINSVEGKHVGSQHSSARNSVTKDSNDWLNVDDIDVI